MSVNAANVVGSSNEQEPGATAELPPAHSPGRRVLREVGSTSRLIRHLMNPPLTSAGITQAEYYLLALLEEHGTSTGKDLATHLSLDKTTVSRQLAALEEAQLITRTVDPANRRSQLITLTPAGAERLGEARQRALSVLIDRFSAWPEEELELLANQLTRFNQVLRGE